MDYVHYHIHNEHINHCIMCTWSIAPMLTCINNIQVQLTYVPRPNIRHSCWWITSSLLPGCMIIVSSVGPISTVQSRVIPKAVPMQINKLVLVVYVNCVCWYEFHNAMNTSFNQLITCTCMLVNWIWIMAMSIQFVHFITTIQQTPWGLCLITCSTGMQLLKWGHYLRWVKKLSKLNQPLCMWALNFLYSNRKYIKCTLYANTNE